MIEAVAVPEGDALHRAAARLQVLVGQRVDVETPHPRAAVLRLPDRLDGRRLESVEAVGKHLLLRFEGGLVLRSHLRMTGRWRVGRRGATRSGTPWLVLRGAEHEAVLWNGPVLELSRGGRPAVGPDLLADPFEPRALVARLRAAGDAPIGEALLDQRLVAGIGNLWRAEALWEARVSPWEPVSAVPDERLEAVLTAARRAMSASVAGARPARRVYRRPGRPCPRCGAPIRSRPQGEHARIAYWCPTCQAGGAGAP
jgi:endonuclease VIII